MSNDKKQLDRIEDLLTQLIGNVASIRSEMTDFKNGMTDFKNEMADFRVEVNQRFESVQHVQQELAGQVALLNQRLDYQLIRIAKAEEEVHILKERQ